LSLRSPTRCQQGKPDHDPQEISQMNAAVRPVNQHARILTLRLAFLAILPLIAMTEPAMPWIFLREGMEPLGVLLIVAGVMMRFWAILYIGGRKNETVVRTGPYSICRHPLYLGSFVAILGFGLLTLTLTLTLLISTVGFAILWVTARREERFLRARFGPLYEAYAARVPRLWPKPSLFTSPPEVTFATSDLRTNLRDAVVLLSLFPLIEILDYLQIFNLFPTITLW
jgi:protein-S-isoprenylcysteine O-methyltransferase Ste14